MTDQAILLAKAGFLLFTLGLLLGAVISKVRNPRMALSAHLTAVQTGTALIAVALIWSYLAVPESWTLLLIMTLIMSSYVLTAGIFLAGVFGASKTLPIAGKGFSASTSQERIVSVLVLGSSVAMTAACIVICFFMLTN